jgi:thymidylate synthase (FAD)
MKIIEPYIEVEEFDGVKIMKNIERACRTCYRSEGLITDDSYKNLLTNCINRGHQSVLEHEKITVRMVCDIGVYKDLTRHRFGSFSIESTRYCNYGKDKFDNEIKFIKPCNINEDSDLYTFWKNTMERIEMNYIHMSNNGATPDQMRMILPHSTAAQVTMTANIREWRHILSLRCAKMTHPSVRQLCIPLLIYFQAKMPELFKDIEFDTNFDPEQFAQISVMKDGEN